MTVGNEDQEEPRLKLIINFITNLVQCLNHHLASKLPRPTAWTAFRRPQVLESSLRLQPWLLGSMCIRHLALQVVRTNKKGVLTTNWSTPALVRETQSTPHSNHLVPMPNSRSFRRPRIVNWPKCPLHPAQVSALARQCIICSAAVPKVSLWRTKPRFNKLITPSSRILEPLDPL